LHLKVFHFAGGKNYHVIFPFYQFSFLSNVECAKKIGKIGLGWGKKELH
jgi:hypothetical protein